MLENKWEMRVAAHVFCDSQMHEIFLFRSRIKWVLPPYQRLLITNSFQISDQFLGHPYLRPRLTRERDRQREERHGETDGNEISLPVFCLLNRWCLQAYWLSNCSHNLPPNIYTVISATNVSSRQLELYCTTRGVATGVYRYIYPPKISPPKILWGIFSSSYEAEREATASRSYWNYNLQDFLLIS